MISTRLRGVGMSLHQPESEEHTPRAQRYRFRGARLTGRTVYRMVPRTPRRTPRKHHAPFGIATGRVATDRTSFAFGQRLPTESAKLQSPIDMCERHLKRIRKHWLWPEADPSACCSPQLQRSPVAATHVATRPKSDCRGCKVVG
jgi:hypothetical protein